MPETHLNPTPEELRTFTEAMPQARLTEFGNVNVQTKVTSRSAGEHARRAEAHPAARP